VALPAALRKSVAREHRRFASDPSPIKEKLIAREIKPGQLLLDRRPVGSGVRARGERLEARAALDRFQLLAATRDADAATSLLRRLGELHPPDRHTGQPGAECADGT